MKKIFLAIMALVLCTVISGLVQLASATSPPPSTVPGKEKETDSPLMLDTKPELAPPKPQPPTNLRVPGVPEERVTPPAEKREKEKESKK